MEVARFLIVAAIGGALLGYGYRGAQRRIQRIIGCVLLVACCGSAYLGWTDYQRNREAFQRSFVGNTAANFESMQGFLKNVKLGSGESMVFYVGEDGRARPGTLWQVGRVDFVLAFIFLACGFGILLRRGRITVT